MKWEKLLCSERLGDSSYQPDPHRPIFVQDHDRIIFSAPFRRLANKTQVEPLYENDHVHHRLIHSIEVSSVGRSLAMNIGHGLEEERVLPRGAAHDMGNIVQAACVAHDIGNPPFGHSGEKSMGDWFAERFAENRGITAEIAPDLRPEFTKFEGNAQGFRILTRLEMYRNAGGMRLSKATLGAFTKYPAISAVSEARDIPYVGLKKFGLFRSEEALFAEAAETMGLPQESHSEGRWWRRHPLVFIVEAADDICYNVVDLEDAFTTGELPFETVRDLLQTAGGNPNRDVSGLSRSEHIAFLRSRAIGAAIESCAAAFRDNYDAIMDGSFSTSLLEASAIATAFQKMKSVSTDQIFTGQRKTELEISGRRVIANVMTGVLPVFEDLAAKGWDPEKLSEHNRQLTRALSLDLRAISTPCEAMHALGDFVSGMTDRYAVRMSRMLRGI